LDAYLAKALLERLAKLEEEVRMLKNPPINSGYASTTNWPYNYTQTFNYSNTTA
jgi:hypothetical protein